MALVVHHIDVSFEYEIVEEFAVGVGGHYHVDKVCDHQQRSSQTRCEPLLCRVVFVQKQLLDYEHDTAANYQQNYSADKLAVLLAQLQGVSDIRAIDKWQRLGEGVEVVPLRYQGEVVRGIHYIVRQLRQQSEARIGPFRTVILCQCDY